MNLLDKLRGGLVVSCQPVDNGPMDRPEIVAALAQAAIAGGANGVRIEGVENLRAVRAQVSVPIIGILKRDLPDSPVRITPFAEDVRALVAAGADIVAYDATARVRPVSREDILETILAEGALAMADCATLADGKAALAGGASIIGTTLSGYTAETETTDKAPDFELIRSFEALGGFVMAEGRFNTPDLARAAIHAGASCVTVGSAITRTEHVTGWFRKALDIGKASALNGFAVDLGGTKIMAARIVDGQVVDRRQSATDGAAGMDAQLEQIAALLSAVGYKHGASLGVAVTGRLDAEGRWHAINTGTLSDISGALLAQALRKRFGAVSCWNDAAATAFAEAQFGSGRGCERFVYITVSTGVGGGIVLNGRLLQGRTGLAGHVGFTVGRSNTTLCGSGRRGTVESIAAGRAIMRDAEAAGHPNTDARAVFLAAENAEGWAVEIVERSANAIACLCADLAALFEPDCIAIGGSIGLAPGYLERVRKHLKAEPPLFRTYIESAMLSGDGPLLGALALRSEA